MSASSFSISRLERGFASGGAEALTFVRGVNLLVGPPNTGKTKWLQTLDFLLADTGNNPFEGADEEGLADKYDSAAADLLIGGSSHRIERRWREAGSKGKVYIDGVPVVAKEFQRWLLDHLDIPLLHFPKGNPMSGQTWPELSFRILLRHIYRQQRFWNGLVDQQPDAEQHASLLQFMGLADRIFTDDYGQYVELSLEADRLRTRRDHYARTLDDVAHDLVAEEDKGLGVNRASLAAARERLAADTASLVADRAARLEAAAEARIDPSWRGRIEELGFRRVELLGLVEGLGRSRTEAVDRAETVALYARELSDENERIDRAQDAGAILADLKITHCPACDQQVSTTVTEPERCFLCHNHLPPEPAFTDLGMTRLRFERDRIASEIAEAKDLAAVLGRDVMRYDVELAAARAELRDIDAELAPARVSVSALAQPEVTRIDMELGRTSERERQLDRLEAALDVEDGMGATIEAIEKRIVPIQERLREAIVAVDFGVAAGWLEDGMNEYLEALNRDGTRIWRHNAVRIDLDRRGFTMRVGRRRWSSALGGTDSLYFMMAYHYGLMTLSAKPQCRYPAFAIIDVPGEFSGVAIGDKENFIVQPFIDLLARPGFEEAQVIITGAAFTGLAGANFQRLRHVHVA